MSDDTRSGRTWATLRILGEHLDPSDVTARLQIVPSRAFIKGDRRGTDGVWRHGYWGMTSQDKVQSMDLQLHIAWLLKQLEPVQVELKVLIAQEGIKADVFCFWEIATGNTGLVLSSETLGLLGKLNLELAVDIYLAS